MVPVGPCVLFWSPLCSSLCWEEIPFYPCNSWAHFDSQALSLHNSWFSSKTYILWSHFLPFLLLLLQFLSDIAPPNKLNTQGLGQGIMFLYHPRWSKNLSHFLFLFFFLFWGNLISKVAFLFYGWRHNASCLRPQPGTTLGQGKEARAFDFISPAKLHHQPSTERLNQ